jgi:hypothetical protein
MEGVAGSVGSEDRDVVGAIGKKRAIPSGSSEALMDLPYALGVTTGWEVPLLCTFAYMLGITYV